MTYKGAALHKHKKSYEHIDVNGFEFCLTHQSLHHIITIHQVHCYIICGEMAKPLPPHSQLYLEYTKTESLGIEM